MALLDGEREAAAADQIIRAAESNSIVEVDSCSICLLDIEDGESATLHPCGHAFHQACIDQWLHSCAEVNSGRRLGRTGLLGTLSCPNCRQCPTLSDAEARRLFPCQPGASGTLERLDQAPTASPENEYLSGVVRRVQRANQTRGPTGRIRFFRPEDGYVTVMGKSVLYAVLFVPAGGYFLIRHALIPGARRIVFWVRDSVSNLPPPPDICAIAAEAGRATYDVVVLPLKRATAYTGGLVRRGASATKLLVYDGVLVPVGLTLRNQLVVPLRDGCAWALRTTRDGAVWALRTGRDGGVFCLQTVRDRLMLPARDGGVQLLRTARDRLLLPARDSAVLVVRATRDGGVWLLCATRDTLLVPARDGAARLLRAIRDGLLVPVADGAVALLRTVHDRLIVPLMNGGVLVIQRAGDAAGTAARWLWRVLLVPTGQGAWRLGGLLWRSIATMAARFTSAAFRGAVHVGMSLLEVAYVLRDVLVSGFEALKRAARVGGRYLRRATKVALAPLVVAAQALMAVGRAGVGAVAVAATKTAEVVAIAAAIVARGAVAVYDYALRPAYREAMAACAVVAGAAAAFGLALYANLLTPIAKQSRLAANALAAHGAAVLATLHTAMLRPLLDAMVAAVAVARETGAAIKAGMERALAAVSVVVQQMGAAMAQAQSDLAAALRELYQMLEKAANRKTE